MSGKLHGEFDRDDETLRVLHSAAQLEEPEPPAELVERVRGLLQAHLEPIAVRSGEAPRGRAIPARRESLRRTWAIAATVAIAISVTALMLVLQRQATWAQVAEAVRAKPWVLLTFPSTDGVPHQQWMSFSREQSARRDSKETTFHDHRLKVIYRYLPDERTIIRSSGSPRESELSVHRGLDRILQDIFRGADKLEFPLPGAELASQSRREVEREGRKWLSYELTLRGVGEQQAEMWKMMLLVDPATRLPQLLLMSSAHREKAGEAEKEVVATISYPDPGPVDIYDLGAPRDARLVDKVPPADVQALAAGVKASLDRFGDFLVLNINATPTCPWYVGTPMAVWRKGNMERHVMGVVNSEAPPAAVPGEDADQHAWWKARWRELVHVPSEVEDGKSLWINDARQQGIEESPLTQVRSGKRGDVARPKWRRDSNFRSGSMAPSPLFFVYPNVAAEYPWEAVLESHPPDGPPNTVRLILRAKSPQSNVATEHRYWIDPTRSYLVVRNEAVNLDTSQTPPRQTLSHTFSVEKAERSPRGIWYPTVMRYKGVWEENGEEKSRESITHHYFDFAPNFPEELFQPAERQGEPLD